MYPRACCCLAPFTTCLTQVCDESVFVSRQPLVTCFSTETQTIQTARFPLIRFAVIPYREVREDSSPLSRRAVQSTNSTHVRVSWARNGKNVFDYGSYNPSPRVFRDPFLHVVR